MRTSNLLLVAAVFVFGLSSSTLKAQLSPRPFLSVTPQVYQRPSESPVFVAAAPATSFYGPNSKWYPYVIARPQDRQWIRETPVELRPNRPLHFWGNSKRRMRR